jgi:molybdenum-dependent DNA-binding transcriptional regulator ModE
LLEAIREKQQKGSSSQTTGSIRQAAERHGISEDEAREMLDEMGF